MVLETWFCDVSCLEVDAREERGSYTLWRQRLVEEDLATLGFVLTTLSLYLYLVSSYLRTVVSALMKLI